MTLSRVGDERSYGSLPVCWSLFEPCSLKLAFNLAKDSFETASGSDARRHE